MKIIEVTVMKKKLSWFDKLMAAVTFAEANEHDTAKEFLIPTGNKTATKKECKDCDALFSSDMHSAELR